jgi:hypothetical protein
MSLMMKITIEKLMRMHGLSAQFAQAQANGEEFHLKVEPQAEALMPLVVEVVYHPTASRVSVLHYFKQMGDTMYDPEVVFEVKDGRWRAVEFTQHSLGVYEDFSNTDTPNSLHAFCRQWARNLNAQGYLEPERDASSLSHSLAEVSHAS